MQKVQQELLPQLVGATSGTTLLKIVDHSFVKSKINIPQDPAVSLGGGMFSRKRHTHVHQVITVFTTALLVTAPN